MQSKFPILSSFVDFLHHNELATIELSADTDKPWPPITYAKQQVLSEFVKVIKETQAAGPWIAYENDGHHSGQRYWETKAPGVSKVIGTGGVFYGSLGGIRWEAFCNDDNECITATLRLIPLPRVPSNDRENE